MSFDMFANEERANLIRVMAHPSLEAEPGIWHNFLPGAGTVAMQGLAITARGIDLLGSVPPIIQDKLTGGTAEQDKYFQEHDDTWQRAVDYWTPKAGEVGTAGRVVGSLVSGLTTVIASPGLAVAGTQLGTGEDLVRKGVDSGKAMAAGAVSGTGLGLGIYMPILGNSLASRVILGGAASNVAQGIATRGINQAILKDTAGEKDFNPWDKESLILDGLMGAAFGTLAHLTAPEKAAIDKTLTPTDKDAILTANQARHIEDTTAPGRPMTDADLTAHATAVSKAVDDVLNGRAANVEQSLQDVKFANDAAKVAAQQEVIAGVRQEAAHSVATSAGEDVVYYHGTREAFDKFDESAPRAVQVFKDSQGFYFSKRPDDASGYATGKFSSKGPDDLSGSNVRPVYLDAKNLKAVDEAPSYISPKRRAELEAQGYDGVSYRNGDEVVVFRSDQIRSIFDEIKLPEPKLPKVEAQPPVAPKAGETAKPIDPIVAEAHARVAANPDLQVHVGTDAQGNPVTQKLSDVMRGASAEVAQAKKEVGLFKLAAQCLLGGM